MVNVNIPPPEDYAVFFTVAIDGADPANLQDFSIREITLGESLLTPGLQTSVLVDSFLHASVDDQGKALPPKNFDDFKNKNLIINLERPMLDSFGIQTSMQVKQRVYRLDNRQLINNNNERFRIHACDDSLLNDARTRVSKSWKCTSPSAIVGEVLQSCAGVTRLEVEDSTPVRDYIAENIHPFQVVTQQANAALAAGDDPSFIHYMTYEDLGTHKFRSIYSLSRETPAFNKKYFVFSETGSVTGYNNPFSIMTYSFPCDFDLLSDLLNGVDVNGQPINTLTTVNPLAGTLSMLGNQALGCGLGGGVYNLSKTNINTEQAQDQCAFEVEKYLLKRQARMGLLEQDKIALKLTVPWNPELNVGKMINVGFIRKGSGNEGEDRLYGSGTYLIVNLLHTIKSGGLSTTSMDCVAQTAGQGIV
jgi:hypothetical protein